MSDLVSRDAVIAVLSQKAETYRTSARQADEAGHDTAADMDRESAEVLMAAVVVVAALPAVQPRVKPLVWQKSHIKPWREDWHTVPTGYTVRCADEWGWKWTSPLGAHGYENTPDIAKAAAQADYEARILSALGNNHGKETK
jgi:hypothetical protein